MFFRKPKYKTEEDLIKACLKGKRDAQQQLFELHADVMLSVALRYMGDKQAAEDVLLQAFGKVFEKLDSFQHQGSFQGWVRRIVCNEALNQLRKNKRFSEDLETAEREGVNEAPSKNLEAEELMTLIQQLPEGYRTVFNLYAIEGYSHQEIAEQLNISIGTSKSQLNRARRFLQKEIEKANNFYALDDQFKTSSSS